MRITIDFQVGNLLKSVAAVRQALEQPDLILANVGETLLRVNRARHEAEVDPEGNPWKPLSELTKLQKRKNRILYENGDLLRFAYQVEGNSVRIWTADKKAEWHHKGTEPYTITPKKAQALKFGGLIRKRVHHPGLPSRPLIGFPDSDQRLVENVITDHLLVLFNGL